MARKLWYIWLHGLSLAFVYGIGLVLGFLYLALPAFIINGVVGLVGWGMPEDELFDLLLALFFIWVPLGIGSVARYGSSDALKAEGYPGRSRPPAANI